ncbi:MAG TPA: hypothetical protein PLW31_04075 [Bacteroidales bacterium]|nr:hypothetical protein [Bacteroidales bacterium]HPI84888.1 hypothetical protein [Bacteroidales bacterium]
MNHRRNNGTISCTKLWKAIIGFLALASFLLIDHSFGQVIIVDLNFILVQDEDTNGGHFDIKLQIRNDENSHQDTFGLGSSNVRFHYNSDAIANPILITTHPVLDEGIDPNGSIYDSMFINQPIENKICGLNIVLLEGPGFDVADNWIDMATIRFTIIDSTQIEKLFWRNDSIVPLTFIQTGGSEYLYCYLGSLNYYLPGIWRGIINSDWFNASNWSDIAIPLSEKNIYVPAETPYDLILSPGITAECNDFNLLDSATIILQPSSTMIIHGNANLINSNSLKE